MKTLTSRMMKKLEPIIKDLESGKDVRTVTLEHEMSFPRLKECLRHLGKEDLIGVKKKRNPTELTVDQLKVVSSKYFTGTPLQALAFEYEVSESMIREQIAANLPNTWDGV